MSICWYCHWGWARPVVEIYNTATAALDDDEALLDFGPGHIVWADENFETSSIEGCLEPEWFDNPDYWPEREITPDQKRIVRQSLEKLLLVPEEIRCCEPEDYDDEHPENFPPPEGVIVIRKGDFESAGAK